MAAVKRTTKAASAAKVDEVVETPVETEEIQESVSMDMSKAKTAAPKAESKKEPRKFEQTDPILCRSVTPGWMAAYGKSGMQYVFYNYGDECEIEYGDLYALKNRRSRYLYDPLFVIEDEELLEHPRWKDLADFYSEKVYGMDDINYVINLPNNRFKSVLQSLPKGLLKALTVEVSKRIEDGSFDSVKKVKVIDEVCGTDFWAIMSGLDD